MLGKTRFLFFGKRAWEQRDALAGSFIKDLRRHGALVQVRAVVTPKDFTNTLKALKATRDSEEWSNLCYGNIDLKAAKPLCDILWPSSNEPPGDPLDCSLPTHVNAYMTRAVRVRKR